MSNPKIPKVHAKAKSAPAPITPAQATQRIHETLRCLVVPRNPLCEANAAVTLENARELMELLQAIEATQTSFKTQFQMPEGGESAIVSIRKMVLDAVEYATELCEGEDNLRDAFDRGEYEKPAAAGTAVQP